MSFTKWVENSRRRFRELPVSTAATESAWEFADGVISNTVGPHIGTSIWELEDEWDVLCVLDACRVDTMRTVAPEFDWITEDVGSIWSVGSYSGSWIARTFGTPQEEFVRQTGYISGNMYTDREVEWEPELPLDTDRFAYYYPGWRHAWQESGSVYTVAPDPLTDRAIDIWRRRGDLGVDKLVVHYMQPHQPFIGYPELADEHQRTEGRPEIAEADRANSVWKRTRDGHHRVEDVREAYTDNLRTVLRSVETLVENCDANVALTADHGNSFGTLGIWGHPDGSLHPSVRRVPWVRVEGRDLETHVPDLEAETVDADEEELQDDIESRLAQLGYLDRADE